MNEVHGTIREPRFPRCPGTEAVLRPRFGFFELIHLPVCLHLIFTSFSTLSFGFPVCDPAIHSLQPACFLLCESQINILLHTHLTSPF